MSKVQPQVTLLSHTDDPVRSLYMAYRVCYSALTPQQIAERIEDERITHERMASFVSERLATGHTSPLEQVSFEFGISGVSRAFSHQLVRHRVGINFEQQSQRYVTYKDGFPYLVPSTIEDAEMDEEFETAMSYLSTFYQRLVEEGVPAEDARFLLPNATSTNFKITINFAAMLHLADLRMCLAAQWEAQRIVGMMRREIVKVSPLLGKMLGPKCMSYRRGACDESLKTYHACKLSASRPHRDELEEQWQNAKRSTSQEVIA